MLRVGCDCCNGLCPKEIGFAGGRGGEGVRRGDETKSSKSSKRSLVLPLEDVIRLVSERTDEMLELNEVVAPIGVE